MANLYPTSDDILRLDAYIESLKIADELHANIVRNMRRQCYLKEKLELDQRQYWKGIEICDLQGADLIEYEEYKKNWPVNTILKKSTI